MRIEERYVVPGLGVIILLSLVALNVSLIYLVVLGILGMAAIGTYFLPHAVQIETRIVISALGLLILFIYFSSLGFWLALLAFGAIGAFQFRHSQTVRTFPQHTIAWLKETLGQQGAATTTGSDADSEAGETAQPAAGLGAMQGRLGVLQSALQLNVGSIVASVMGLFAVLSILMPWAIYIVSFGDESVSEGYTILQVAADEELGGGITRILFVILLALGLASAASVVLPRVVGIISGAAGMAMTLLTFIFISVVFARASEGAYSMGVSTFTFPHLGFFVTGGCFMVITVVRAIPALNKPKGMSSAAPEATAQP